MVFLYNSYHIISVDQEREIVADKMLTFFERTAAGPDPSRPAA
jgi:esterase/lipase